MAHVQRDIEASFKHQGVVDRNLQVLLRPEVSFSSQYRLKLATEAQRCGYVDSGTAHQYCPMESRQLGSELRYPSGASLLEGLDEAGFETATPPPLFDFLGAIGGGGWA